MVYTIVLYKQPNGALPDTRWEFGGAFWKEAQQTLQVHRQVKAIAVAYRDGKTEVMMSPKGVPHTLFDAEGNPSVELPMTIRQEGSGFNRFHVFCKTGKDVQITEHPLPYQSCVEIINNLLLYIPGNAHGVIDTPEVKAAVLEAKNWWEANKPEDLLPIQPTCPLCDRPYGVEVFDPTPAGDIVRALLF